MPPIRLRILLTNDDGIDAPGLMALRQSVLAACGDRVERLITLAPDRQRSECGHGVSSATPLAVAQVGEDAWSAAGTPVDCVRFALARLCPEVDCVVSGINAGANLGTDLLVSGTFAAAREAHFRGVAAISISQYRRPDIARQWGHAPSWLAGILTDLADRVAAGERRLWNINLPAIAANSPPPPAVECPVDPTPIPLRYRPTDCGRYAVESDFHDRPRRPGGDVDVCFSGKISISSWDAVGFPTGL